MEGIPAGAFSVKGNFKWYGLWEVQSAYCPVLIGGLLFGKAPPVVCYYLLTGGRRYVQLDIFVRILGPWNKGFIWQLTRKPSSQRYIMVPHVCLQVINFVLKMCIDISGEKGIVSSVLEALGLAERISITIGGCTCAALTDLSPPRRSYFFRLDFVIGFIATWSSRVICGSLCLMYP